MFILSHLISQRKTIAEIIFVDPASLVLARFGSPALVLLGRLIGIGHAHMHVCDHGVLGYVLTEYQHSPGRRRCINIALVYLSVAGGHKDMEGWHSAILSGMSEAEDPLWDRDTIAEYLGIARSSVAQWLARQGLQPAHREFVDRGGARTVYYAEDVIRAWSQSPGHGNWNHQ